MTATAKTTTTTKSVKSTTVKKGKITSTLATTATSPSPTDSVNIEQPHCSIEQKYQKKTQLEHILLRPDTYIGSIEKQTETLWVYDQKKIVKRPVTFVPGLFKIFDEILVNASDNKQRDPQGMTKLEVTIDAVAGSVRVMNNGSSIPIVEHKEHGVYVAELIFGHLLTGSNFDDKEEKTTGGRNGYGAKLTNIFSTKFVVETADKAVGMTYRQEFSNNMSVVGKPVVKSLKSIKDNYTSITFFPDLKRFGMERLDDDIIALFAKRAHDVALTAANLVEDGAVATGEGVTKPKTKKVPLKVYLNGELIEVRTARDYLALHEGLEAPIAVERVGERWEIGVGVSDGTFSQISFVNSIATTKGGTHVAYITDQIVSRLAEALKKKSKSAGMEVKPQYIKSHLFVFVNCLIVNPAFDSQTKENLTTKVVQFGSSCEVPDKVLKALERSAALSDTITKFAQFKQNNALKKAGATGGGRRSVLLGIPKLDDANFAGTAKSAECTLILTEGDSAKALAVSGLSVIGRDRYGVFPLRGKLLNVRDASHAQIMANEEIQNVAKILGLQFGKTYTDTSSLRYGHLMIMTDQDHDGSHIKGLVINFLDHFWPSLLWIPGFLVQFITPIVVASRASGGAGASGAVPLDSGKADSKKVGKDRKLTFFTIPQYEEWKKKNNNGKGWKIKYYKGLGTSTAAEAKEYFSDLKTHEIVFTSETNATNVASNPSGSEQMDVVDSVVTTAPPKAGAKRSATATSAATIKFADMDADAIDMAFSKKRVEDRKRWLMNLCPDTFMDYSKKLVSYNTFVNNELILFSNADNIRSIAHMLDGLKPSQRKVLFAAFKRNLKDELKVVQLAGYVSEQAAYHHGEQSLTQTIINMAQNFVGSNNLNLLSPCGQFGTRLMGGKDHASARYVFTKLEVVTRAIFHPDDDELLTYLDDDGQQIEPEFYVPVIPMVLVNGCEGIGTGWSSSVPLHDPRAVITRLREKLATLLLAGDGNAVGNDGVATKIVPWYRGFTGTIQEKVSVNAPVGTATSYTATGSFKWLDTQTIQITELPIGKWTTDYKQFLETLVIGKKAATSEDNDKKDKKTQPFIKEFKENHTDVSVNFTIILGVSGALGISDASPLDGGRAGSNAISSNAADSVSAGGAPLSDADVVRLLKLETSISTNNMHLFDANSNIKKYASAEQVVDEFFPVRLDYYARRREAVLKRLCDECAVLDMKVRFIRAVIDGSLVITNRKKADIAADFVRVVGCGDAISRAGQNDAAAESEEVKACLNMQLWSLTNEKIIELQETHRKKTAERDEMDRATPAQLWSRDLDALCVALDDFDQTFIDAANQLKDAQEKARKNSSSNKKKMKIA